MARIARNNRLDSEAQEVYGYALLVSGHADESIEWLQHAVNLRPKHAAYHTNLAAAWHQVGKWEKAYVHARTAYELEPESALHAINVGGFHYWFGETEEAVKYYQRASDIDGNWGKPLFKLGLAKLQKGDTAGTLELMNKLVQVDPNSPEAVQAKGLIEQLKKQ